MKFINDDDLRKKFTFDEIKKSFESHYINCESYRKYCDSCSFTPSQLNDFNDLYSIPQIPTAIFKSVDVYSGDKSECKCCTSSGTKGVVSKIYRDRKTIESFVETIEQTVSKLYGLTKENSVIFNLGPELEEAGDIWLAYVTGFLKNVYETYNFMHSGIFETDKLIEKINNTSGKRIVLLGAPVLFMKLFADLKAKNIKMTLPKDSVAFTVGGWKSINGDVLTRNELCEMFREYLDIETNQYYDIYNQVESNTPFFECKNHKKHIPSGYLVIIRDPVTLEKMNNGEEGIISFLDSSAGSYPSFVISDDIGSVSEKCECGIGGQILNYKRRVQTVEAKGCALKIDQRLV